LYQFAFKQTVVVPSEAGVVTMVSLVPVWPPLWYTSAWLLFTACVVVLVLPRARSWREWSRGNVVVRRLAVLALGLVMLAEVASRLSTHHLPAAVSVGGPAGMVLMAGVAIGLTICLVRPPRDEVLFGLCLAGGLALRLLGLAIIPSNAEFADNLPAIAAGLDRLAQGSSPYGVYTFTNHTNAMAYLPLTFLAYLPAHFAGLDIRLTNIMLSFAQTVGLLAIIRVLRVPEPARCALVLLCGISYILPLNLGHDLYNELQPFELALVVALGLTVTQHFRAAAIGVGVALGAMPMTLFCGPSLLSYGGRRLGRLRLIRLTLVAGCIAAVPVVAFVAWDPASFVQAVTVQASVQFDNMPRALDFWPYSPIWYGLGRWLQPVQIALFAALALVAVARVRTGLGAAQMATLTYLLMLVTGPQSGSHILSALVPLVIVAEAARHGDGDYLAEGVRDDRLDKQPNRLNVVLEAAADWKPNG
jgi:hypothetical protein